MNGSAVTGIADGLFSGNKTLEKVTLPAGCTYISKGAFKGAAALTEINLDGVTEMGAEAFASTGLTSLTVGENLSEIPQGAFQNCGSLKSVKLTGGVKELGAYAFASCGSLESIELNEGLETIHKFALYRDPIRTLHFPSTFRQLSDANVGDPFEEGGKQPASTAMTEVTVEETSPYFTARDGLLYSKDGKTVVFCPRGRTEVKIAEGTD